MATTKNPSTFDVVEWVKDLNEGKFIASREQVGNVLIFAATEITKLRAERDELTKELPALYSAIDADTAGCARDMLEVMEAAKTWAEGYRPGESDKPLLSAIAKLNKLGEVDNERG